MGHAASTACVPRGWPTCTASSRTCCPRAWSASGERPRRRRGAPMPATPGETSATEHELRIAARPETVFGYFTDPEKMVQWMGAEATLDPRPGGVCRIAFQPIQQQLDAARTAVTGTPDEGLEGLGAVGTMMGEFVE